LAKKGKTSSDFRMQSQQLLFPQVLNIVKRYSEPVEMEGRIDYGDSDHREIGLETYVSKIVERLCTSIRPDREEGEAPLLPRLERFRPRGSSADVLFRTSKVCRPTLKSQESHVVLDTKRWESAAAFYLEQSDLVAAYVKNEHLDFTIDYTFNGSRHTYLPDFLVRMSNGMTLILEIKGFEDEQTRAKHEAAKRWCDAVTNWGKMGKWEFNVCKDLKKITEILKKIYEK